MKWLRCLAALATLIFGVQLVTASSSYAASDYDNLIQTSPTLYVYTDGAAKSQKMDISASWLDELDQTYSKRLAAGSGYPSNLMPELYDIRSSGSLGVIMREDTSMGNTVEVFGTSDPNAYCGFTGDAVNGGFGCMAHTGYSAVHVEYFTHNSFGGNGCGYWWSPQTCSDNGMNVYTAPMVITETTQPTQLIWVPNSQASSTKYYYADFDTTYPTGYDGEVIPTQPPNATYVAMGDSFSSGEGNPPFEAGTATSANDCHRSYAAYPRLLQKDMPLPLHLGATAFTACSGATTSTVLNGGSGHGTWDEGPQTQALTADTQVVTITIGGNDIGFSDFAKACALAYCDSSTSIYATTMSKITNDLPAALKTTYEQILTKAPNAKVYVIDYPYVTPSTGMETTDPSNTGCAYLYDGPTHWGNGRAARDVVGAIDSAISSAVTVVQQESNDYEYRLHYVSSNSPSSPFAGHTVCDTGDSYFQNLDQAGADPAYVFHPNGNGHVAYANLVSYAITGGIA